jgi:hypothetical protein
VQSCGVRIRVMRVGVCIFESCVGGMYESREIDYFWSKEVYWFWVKSGIGGRDHGWIVMGVSCMYVGSVMRRGKSSRRNYEHSKFRRWRVNF